MRSSRKAITLLEVLLALAILAGALATLSQLMGIGLRAARDARDMTRGQILCESLMAEMTSGIVEPMSSQGVSNDDPLWNYSTLLESAERPGVARLVVRMQKQGRGSGIVCQLVRMIRDPSLAIPVDEVEESAEPAATTPTSDAAADDTGGTP